MNSSRVQARAVLLRTLPVDPCGVSGGKYPTSHCAEQTCFGKAGLTGMDVDPKQGRAILKGKDSAGVEIKIEIGIAELNQPALQIRRILVTTKAAHEAGQLHQGNTGGEIALTEFKTYAVWLLPMETPDNVALIFDHGEATEIAYRVPVECALDLAEKLKIISDQRRNVSEI